MATPLWHDPLFSPGDRFPLGAPDSWWQNQREEPSTSGARPFSLRGVSHGPTVDPHAQLTFEYCEQSQTGFVRNADGNLIELGRHTSPGPTPGSTTGTTDGQPGQAPPEETGASDYQSD